MDFNLILFSLFEAFDEDVNIIDEDEEEEDEEKGKKLRVGGTSYNKIDVRSSVVILKKKSNCLNYIN